MTRRDLLLAGAVMPIMLSAVPATGKAQRIEALLNRMTLEEKAGQLTLVNDPFRWRPGNVNPEAFDPGQQAVAQEIREGKVGALFNGVGAAQARYAQRLAVEESRLGIPLLLAADVIHGLRTIFPVPLAEAASWDPDLAARTARAAATEAGASGIHQTYAPMVDIARDQRWGRGVEGAGEDVLLGRLFAAARVRGFQGENLRDVFSLVATPKHFAAYGAAEGGLDYAGAELSERALREVYLPPFRAAFDAGACSVMCGFNTVNGIPATANPWLLQQVLRREWDFGGYVVSDYTADAELVSHGFAEDARDAVRLAFMAGVDMSMNSRLYQRYLPELVAAGVVPMARLDDAVRRVLRVKEALGLFDDPWRGMDAEQETRVVRSPSHIALAREAARRSVVLLRNQGGLLPLRPDLRIALIGPFGADADNAFGPWSIFGEREHVITLEAGIRAALADPDRLTVVTGCGIESELPGGIEAAVAAAGASDVVLLAVGESQWMSAEGHSRTEIDLPPQQAALVEAVMEAGRPVVVLLKTGRALALTGRVAEADAIMVTWFLGQEEGNAVADLLFGTAAPSGRLPVSFPRRTGQQPFYYARLSTGRPAQAADQAYSAHYRNLPDSALYPFGHGLTYGSVRYEPPRLSADRLMAGGRLTATARLTNDGARDAEEVAQLYLRDRAAQVAQPRRLLKAFRHVTVPAGGAVEVSFDLGVGELAYLGPDMQPTVDPGWFDLWIAPDAESGVAAAFRFD
ncbi:glycoside hydrolase family 3 N-terminal domain-containing protein [Haematobacter massiliensis]|nr:glycoside hydrolase family 3 N-terminal domain-containing protein [Haematobacter massiliensis]